MEDPDERVSVLDEAQALGRSLENAVKTKQAFPDQVEERETTKDEVPFEYEYW